MGSVRPEAHGIGSAEIERHWHDGGEFFIDVCVGIQDCF